MNIYAFKPKPVSYFKTSGMLLSLLCYQIDICAVSMILAMSSTTDKAIRDQAATIAIIFTGLRSDSLYLAETSNWMKVPADTSSLRHCRLILARTNTNPQGAGPVDGRTLMLPCICLNIDNLAFM